jgi:hypothetical protein
MGVRSPLVVRACRLLVTADEPATAILGYLGQQSAPLSPNSHLLQNVGSNEFGTRSILERAIVYWTLEL